MYIYIYLYLYIFIFIYIYKGYMDGLHLNSYIVSQVHFSFLFLVAKEGLAVVLPCGVAQNPPMRYWYKGFFNESLPTEESACLFHQYQLKEVIPCEGTRPDMSADRVKLALTIGVVQLDDDSWFTCKGAMPGMFAEFHPVKVDVYGETFQILMVSILMLSNLLKYQVSNSSPNKAAILELNKYTYIYV